MGLKENLSQTGEKIGSSIRTQLDRIPGTDKLPGSNLGKRLVQLEQAPRDIAKWARLAQEKENLLRPSHLTPQTEGIIYSDDEINEASLSDFPQTGFSVIDHRKNRGK